MRAGEVVDTVTLQKWLAEYHIWCFQCRLDDLILPNGLQSITLELQLMPTLQKRLVWKLFSFGAGGFISVLVSFAVVAD